jgi:hypothetical protein
MNRIMKRPMFRKGGSAGEGITSGLAPRQGYQGAGDVKQNDLSKLNNIRDLTPQQILELSKQMAFQAPPMAPDNSLRDFKIDFGLDLLSRSPSGNIFQTAGAAAKEPFANFRASRAAYNKGINDRAVTKYNSQTGMFDTLLGAQAKILGSEGGSQMFAKQANDAEIQNIMGSLFELQAQQSTDQALPDEDFARQQAILMQRLQGYTGKNPAVTSLFGNKEQADIVIAGIQQDITNSEKIIKVMGPDGEMIEVVEGEYAGENPKYVGEETARRYVELYNQMVKDSIGLPQPKAEGGRIGYAMGGGADMMQEQITEVSETESMPKETAPTGDSLSYEELRSRLPKEISDDIVSILAESPQALIMFSEIQTQTDVDEFNMAYGVNLSLPSGA